MKIATYAAALAALATNAAALALDGTQTHPKGEWVPTSPAPAMHPVTLVFAVNENLPGLSDAVNAVSDPASPTYGSWLSLDEVDSKWSDQKARDAVRTYLENMGHSPKAVGGGAFFKVTLPANRANALLSADFQLYTKKGSADVVVRADGIRVPKSIAWAIDSVEYATKMPANTRAKIFVSGAVAPDGVANPAIIQQYYGIKDPVVKNKDSTNAVFETIGQSIVAKDVTTFDSNYNIPPQTFTVLGPNDPSACVNPNNCIESTLDVQIITSNAQSKDTITTFWSVPGTESFLQWILAVSNDPKPPWVHSISYGEPEQETGRKQDDSFDKALQKIALRGVSVLVSSGDDGVAGEQARGKPRNCGFAPSYPATATHVTAVGATQGPESGAVETACTSDRGGGITTGGGFSTIYKRPKFQKAQVQNYLKTAPNLPDPSLFASSGRGYPDVGIMGHNYPIVIDGETFMGSGTSASSPVFAAMITLVNDARISAGKPTLGWLNPALYSLQTSTWNNITVGENNCAADGTCCKNGFTALPTGGWNPLTGIGSPKFQKLLSSLSSL